MKALVGSRAWVIGASSGIGAAVAQELVRRGCVVAVSARRPQELAEVSRGRMLEVPVDMSDAAAVQRAAERITAELGAPDIVVIAAGYWQRMQADAFDREAFMRHIDVNVGGMANCIDAVLPQMRQRGSGIIVGIASVAGYRGFPGAQGYGASKAAQLQLLESLRCGLRGTGVQVISVAPGFVDTPMTAENTFPMPFMTTVDVAAQRIVRGIERGRAEVVFPWPMMVMMKLARLVPAAWWPVLMRSEGRG